MRSLRSASGLIVLLSIPFLISDARPDLFAQRYYAQVNLVSDVPGLAARTDPNLVNPWGISRSATSPFWVSDNGAGVATLYNGAGTPLSLVVTVPPPAGGSGPATPTGQVFNSTTGFEVASGKPAFFIFATEDGTISGWNPTVDPTHAILKVDRSSTAVYKGLALLGSNLYAANFKEGRIDVFDSNFNFVGSATDASVPTGYAPFDIAHVNGTLMVTFALQDSDKEDDVAGPGNGYVSIFNPAGGTFTRFASRGPLNSPWGLALAPADFGLFSGDLLVGNFGDGRISAFNASTGRFIAQLRGPDTNLITIPGLWALEFGNGAAAGPANVLFFTAGINDEQHGLFGALMVGARRDLRPGLF